MLYPGLDLGKKFHEDHIFPKSRFTKRKLTEAGVPPDKIDDYLDTVNLLPNLQLLAGTANIEKQDALPADWIAAAFPSPLKRETYVADNDLADLPLDLAGFSAFFEKRKQRVRARLIAALSRSASNASALASSQHSGLRPCPNVVNSGLSAPTLKKDEESSGLV
ncbi:MAG: hypothetical protein WAV45_04595, partial [Propionibacteriaceae bacterium]